MLQTGCMATKYPLQSGCQAHAHVCRNARLQVNHTFLEDIQICDTTPVPLLLRGSIAAWACHALVSAAA